MPLLIGIEGPLAGQELKFKSTSIVGRSFDAQIRIDDLSVSRQHARITVNGLESVIEDMGSGNGTFVNDRQIAAPTPLKDGDLLRFAGNVFRYASITGTQELAAAVQLKEPTSPGKAPVVETLNVKGTLMDIVMSGAAQQEPDALRKATERLRTVLEVSNAVQTRLDMNELLGEILDRLFGVFPQADRGFIMLKEDGGELATKAAKERGKTKPAAITVSKSIIDKALTGRVAILSADAMSDTRFGAAMSIMNFQIRSMMCAPLFAGDEPLGIVHLDTTRQDKRFTRDDLDLLTAVANQMALSVANARMHKRLINQQRIERDLALARQVQESFLPRKLPELPNVEFAATYKAALDVGGDFYNFTLLSGGRVALVIGDVAGKGIPAAMVMAQMTSDVRSFVQGDPTPAHVVKRLNTEQCARNTDGFVTVIYGILDPAARTLTLVNAAHPPPIVRRADGAVAEQQDLTNFPVGAMEDAEYQAETIQLQPGDVIALFSDGITEAMDARQDLFGVDRLKAAVSKPAASARDVMANVLADVQSFVGGAYQSDDLTLVCLGMK
jgi:serine phosphatase RsbU (regulator of sigma subunit)